MSVAAVRDEFVAQEATLGGGEMGRKRKLVKGGIFKWFFSGSTGVER